jgi:phosphoribosyl-ATP pyrophosphohydrolase/phosphoribosyl-AMP cyclohydrolase
MTPADLTYDAEGLIPAVVQEADTGEVLMVAWMNRDALDATLESGVTHFWSRSRRTLWRKGETSGHTQHVRSVHVDCDADTLLVLVDQDGGACHTGERTCFFRGLSDPRANGAVADPPRPPANMLERLEQIVDGRRTSAPPRSYVGSLLAMGEGAVCRKVGEEAVEVITAALGGEGDARVVEEIADLWFHTLVLLGQRRIPLRRVLKELARRHQARTPPGAS